MKKLLGLMLLAGSPILFGQFSVGIRIGAPPAPRVIQVRPTNPGPSFVWVDGYWYPTNDRYAWHDGYYSRPPYEGAVWIIPRYESQQYYQGFWQAGSRQLAHDHTWDADVQNRDYNRQGKGNANADSKGKGKGKGSR